MCLRIFRFQNKISIQMVRYSRNILGPSVYRWRQFDKLSPSITKYICTTSNTYCPTKMYTWGSSFMCTLANILTSNKLSSEKNLKKWLLLPHIWEISPRCQLSSEKKTKKMTSTSPCMGNLSTLSFVVVNCKFWTTFFRNTIISIRQLKWQKKLGQLFLTANDETTAMLIYTDHLIASCNILTAPLSVLLPINLLSHIFSFTINTEDIILSV